MQIGIGLPNAIQGIDRRGIVDWARRAEAAGFSTLGAIDRIAYLNYEPLIALAAAAAVTERIRLMTDILIAPLRANTALFAKQAATIDHLSGGRLVLGLGVGLRADDFEVSGVDFHTRGRAFEAQLAELARLWDGEGGVGPRPPGGRPRIVMGGGADVAFRRAAEHAEGWTMGGGPPDSFAEAMDRLRAAWAEAGREDEPRGVAMAYFCLGENAEEVARRNFGDYYAFLGEWSGAIADASANDADAVKELAAAYEAAGADEVIFVPGSPDPEQVDLLADAAGLGSRSSAGAA
ncbi:MAG: LLM class flavin-dependent oxidoreductase [Thermoleophilaceae bacterium]|nr:LLM class flavin-dependent oxidoreductase [Thermoleophilaceae bacterium]